MMLHLQDLTKTKFTAGTDTMCSSSYSVQSFYSSSDFQKSSGNSLGVSGAMFAWHTLDIA